MCIRDRFHTGQTIPQIGIGTWRVNKKKPIFNMIDYAYNSGYRHIDTAVMYENEHFIGKALQQYKIPRKELFLTTKILPQDLTYQKTYQSVLNSLSQLQTDYLDMVLLHWPGAPTLQDRQESWNALQVLKDEGKIINIGVSNFLPKHIESLQQHKDYRYKPVVNQIETHPLYIDTKTIEYCQKNNILIESYSPLAVYNKKLINNSKLIAISQKYKKSIAQVVLRWHLQQGFIVIPKSLSQDHIQENISISNFQLSQDDMNQITKLNCNYKTDWDPCNID
eukprot:TRINITY_DN10416_c0_g1_i1.p1 TRINITY_DN10416_c0_g1~~TRINITY_DN10416_c0_g1_i1.p1  ORF type:complete len:279 (+),score=35.40 TRINITY_DN10416_c0_g1_i1:144-980(+)